MSQLVGLKCTRCDERIKSIHDGTVCSACGCPVHKRCMRPGGTGCGACGTPSDAARAYRREADQRAERREHELRSHRRAQGVLLIVVGVLLIAVAVLASLVSLGGWRIACYGAGFAGLALAFRGVRQLVTGRRR